MKLNRKAFVPFFFVLSAILVSCTQIPYDKVVIPVFKEMHPYAEPSQIYPIGGYGAESYSGGKTDIVIHFKEGGEFLEETWTVTRKGGEWDVRFKCKSAGNVCIEEKGRASGAK